MALATLPGGFVYHPHPMFNINGSFGTRTHQINAASEAVAWIRRADATNTIRRVGFYVSAVGTGGDVEVEIQGVDLTNGEPDGAEIGTATVTHTIAAGWNWADFGEGNGASVTIGDLIAVVITEGISSTPDVTIRFASQELVLASTFPYASTNVASSWTPNSANGGHILAFDTSGDATGIVPGSHLFPYTSVAFVDFNSGDTPDEVGIMFQFPFKCRVVGGWVAGDFDGNFDLVLYDTDGSTALATTSVDKDVRGNTSRFIAVHMFPSAHVLSINSNYRLAVKPGATDLDIVEFTVDSASILDAWEGGSEIHKTAQTNGGGFTQTTTVRPYMGLIIDQLDDGVSAGGSGGLKLAGAGGLAG